MKKLLQIQPGSKETFILEESNVMVEIGMGAEVTVEGVVPGKQWFVLDEGAKLNLELVRLGNNEDETVVELRGDDSEVLTKVFSFAKDREQQQLKLVHLHTGARTKSRMITKGAVAGQAQCYVSGTIRMEPSSLEADGVLEEHNLLLSDDASVQAKPNLEIGHDDVKASHSATIERIDDEKLFYLTSRGISNDEAAKLILEGFFEGHLTDIYV